MKIACSVDSILKLLPRYSRSGVILVSHERIVAWAAWMMISGASPATIRARTGALARLDRECGPLDAVTHSDLMVWLAQFTKASTRSTNLSYVHCYFDWALGEGHIEKDPTARLPKVKVPKSTPRPVPTSQLEQMMALATFRDRLWLELMAFCGLRVSEVALCRPEHVWRSVEGTTWLRIPRGKGGAEQQVPIPGWLAERLSKAEPWDIGPQAVYRHTHALLVAVGSTSTPHSLRHWFGTASLRSTGNLRTVQTMMRHQDPSSTARYTLISADEVSAASEALPRFVA